MIRTPNFFLRCYDSSNSRPIGDYATQQNFT